MRCVLAPHVVLIHRSEPSVLPFPSIGRGVGGEGDSPTAQRPRAKAGCAPCAWSPPSPGMAIPVYAPEIPQGLGSRTGSFSASRPKTADTKATSPNSRLQPAYESSAGSSAQRDAVMQSRPMPPVSASISSLVSIHMGHQRDIEEDEGCRGKDPHPGPPPLRRRREDGQRKVAA